MENQKPVEIDYSEAYSDVADLSVAEANWEPPPHVFYGKRMANGKSEKEPVYSYQEYPRMLYKPIEGKVRAKVVNDDKTKALYLNAGWGLSPNDFYPDFQSLPARDVVTRSIATPVEMETEVAQDIPILQAEAPKPKNKGGRPRKNPKPE
jgi:hypothetical protein